MENNIIDIKVYGTKSSGQQLVVQELKDRLIKAGLAFVLKEETDVSVFIKEGLESVPAIKYDNNEISTLRTNGSFNQSLRRNITSILSSKNFGTLPQIIIPTDFSDTSLNALYYGHNLATQMGAVTKVLHVYFPTSKDMNESVFIEADFSKLHRTSLDDFVDKIDLNWGSDMMKSSLLAKEFRTGFPGENILDSVAENNAELVVMGTTGDSNRIKKWFGSVSTKVMNDSPVPVLLVPEQAQFKDIKRVLYAYDDYEMDKACMMQLLNFCKRINTEIHFVHVNRSKNENPGFYIDELIEGKYNKDKISIYQLKTQEVSQALNDYAVTHAIDLMAFGTKQKGLFQKIFTKSITKEMSIHSNLPVLILKP